MKLEHACLSTRKQLEYSFHHCLGSVILLQAGLCAGKTSESRFNLRGGDVKHMQSCLSASKDLESSFHHCGSPVKLVNACLCMEKTVLIKCQ